MSEYYIRNKDAGYLGNSFMWYGKDGGGYTAYINGAHRFTEKEARDLVRQDPSKWEMFDAAEVDKRLHLVFDSQDVKNLGTDAPSGWSGTDYASKRIEQLEQALDSLVAQARDTCGVIDEYVAMPCDSLEAKFPTTSVRLHNRIRQVNEVRHG